MNKHIYIVIIVVLLYLCFNYKYKNVEGYTQWGSWPTRRIYRSLDYQYGKTNTFYDTHSVFSAHPNRLVCHNSGGMCDLDLSKDESVCSHEIDKKMKHIRLNNSGGMMYMSYNEPSEGIFKKIECPLLMTDIIGVRDIDKLNFPQTRDRITCWQK